MVRDLIDAVQGNPSLKSWLYNSAQIDYTWIPYQWFYIGAYATYTRHTKPMDYKYIPTMIDGREMMLRTNVKDGYFQDIEAGVSATIRLFDNSLTIRGDMAFDAYRRGGSRRYTLNVVNGNLSASYYIGDFYFSAMYIFGNKRASVYTVKEDLPSYYNVSGGWSRNGWNLQAEVTNPFRYGKKQQTEYTFYDNYTRIETYFGSHCRCQFWLKATYTIGYGKKLKADNIGKGSSISSGIVE